MAQGLVDSSFRYHLETARKNGITRTEIAEILTHAAFYARDGPQRAWGPLFRNGEGGVAVKSGCAPRWIPAAE